MLKNIKNVLFSFLLSIFVFILIVFLVDAFKFHENDYSTPWYDISFSSPYTNLFLLFFGEKKEYWTTNAVGNEMWLVRDVHYKSQTYWTILKRKDI